MTGNLTWGWDSILSGWWRNIMEEMQWRKTCQPMTVVGTSLENMAADPGGE